MKSGKKNEINAVHNSFGEGKEAMARACTAVPRAFLAVSIHYKHWPFILGINSGNAPTAKWDSVSEIRGYCCHNTQVWDES